MFPTARYDSEANRFAPHSDYLDLEGFDLAGATCKLQIRDRKNGGQLRADLAPTVSVTITAGVPTSRIAWTVPEATMESMPTDPGDPSADVVTFKDLHITPAGGTKFVAAEGIFRVKAGVTE